MARTQDLSFEALVEVTGATVASERGSLNAALKQIREAEPELEDEDLAVLISYRADDYRKRYPGMAVTPTALAKHWNRVREELAQAEHRQVARFEQPTGTRGCATCGGDGMVVTSREPNGYEQVAPCPDCRSDVIAYWQWNGRHFQTPDPAEVRRMMLQ